MARRTHMVLGRGEKSWLRSLMGKTDRKAVRNLLEEKLQLPVLDFDTIEARSGSKIELTARDKIQGEFDDLLISQLAEIWRSRNETFSSEYAQELIANRDFKDLIAKVSKSAAKLRELVDHLVEFDAELAFPPRDTRDADERPSRLRYSIDGELGRSDRVFRASNSDFIEYLCFRRTLDYLENFEDKNRPYNNWYSARWTDETDHNLFELLVRRVVVALRRSGFSMSLTVPTDVAPDYESPSVSVLLEVQEAWNTALAPEIEKGEYLSRTFSYRQMLYLASQILESIESLELALSAFASQRR